MSALAAATANSPLRAICPREEVQSFPLKWGEYQDNYENFGIPYQQLDSHCTVPRIALVRA
ncbi:hypothetical protein CANCADRAFT_139700 [Tortispora caseinolytica NRRL Y-17796]|uniref:Uncharacterized protein n=1 Tax=Tortispora caseinolytica NRRL Y-17796 TaxID=767744 RepID=A0A1E4TCJ5_9ASCO|nr:hypothetical protein CANCADRAFT_139700 [Tortispora caseinolytica NRRL Y-17796]